MNVSSSVKALVALVVAIIAALISALGTGTTDFDDLDTQTWLIAIGAILSSGALVAFVENVPGVAGGIIKAFVGAAGAAVASLVPALDDALLSRIEQLSALSAFVVGLSLVYQIPDPPESPVEEEPRPTSVRLGR